MEIKNIKILIFYHQSQRPRVAEIWEEAKRPGVKHRREWVKTRRQCNWIFNRGVKGSAVVG